MAPSFELLLWGWARFQEPEPKEGGFGSSSVTRFSTKILVPQQFPNLLFVHDFKRRRVPGPLAWTWAGPRWSKRPCARASTGRSISTPGWWRSSELAPVAAHCWCVPYSLCWTRCRNHAGSRAVGHWDPPGCPGSWSAGASWFSRITMPSRWVLKIERSGWKIVVYKFEKIKFFQVHKLVEKRSLFLHASKNKISSKAAFVCNSKKKTTEKKNSALQFRHYFPDHERVVKKRCSRK